MPAAREFVRKWTAQYLNGLLNIYFCIYLDLTHCFLDFIRKNDST